MHSVLLCVVCLLGFSSAFGGSLHRNPSLAKNSGSLAHNAHLTPVSAMTVRMVQGEVTVVAAAESVQSGPPGVWNKVLATWGVVSVLSVIGNALKRLVPVALEPVKNGDLTPFHWAIYVGWTVFMMYTEGYKAFQKKFSPLVVKRAFTLAQNPGVFNWLLAGPYSMGLFGATPKRMKISWAISTMVVVIVQVVKRLPYPWRGIADAGVVAGLTYGSASILLLFLKALFGFGMPDCSAELPVVDKDANKAK